MPKSSTNVLAVNTHHETELLLCCARTCIDTEKTERIRTLLQEDLDWAYLIRTSFAHGVMPLLYTNLNATCPEAVPKAILVTLRDYFHANARRNFLLTGELLKLLELFKINEVRAIPFKGPFLATSAYGTVSLRQFGDLDILVHARDFLKAKNLLVSQGYQLQHQISWEYQHWEYSFVHKDSKVNVDLHQRIAQSYFPEPLNFEQLWERLEPVSFSNTTVLTLVPEDLLLILCVQLVKDCQSCEERLAQFCDIAELVRVHQGMNWDFIIERAWTVGSQRILLLDLLLVNELLGAALPKEVLQRMQADPVVKALAAQVHKRLFHKADGPPNPFANCIFYLKTRERLQDKLQCFFLLFLRAIAPNERDRIFLPLPSFLSFLYYFVRPIRLVRKCSTNSLKYRRRNKQ